MNILFIHQNFPGQFKSLAPALAADPNNTVVALTMRQLKVTSWEGVRIAFYKPERCSSVQIHPWLTDFETKIIRAEACFHAALKLRAQGFVPDIIIAHHGWGESLFLKEVWPDAKLAIYCEFYYQPVGADCGFDPEFQVAKVDDNCRLQLKNLNNLMHFQLADAAISPTHWQASSFPGSFRGKISVIHDGIDTQQLAPNPHASLLLNGKIKLSKNDEIITFVNRNLEPFRGYHIFMRALPEILRRRPNAKVLIVGGDETSYGAKPDTGETWKSIFANEVRPQISDADWQRVRFLGKVSYSHFISLLQLSTVHVYLTYPFVLSWSLLEAMSIGCSIVASNTAPLHEVIKHGETGRLFEFFDVSGLANEVCNLLDDACARAELGKNARAFAQEHYDLQRVCLPQQLAWVERLMSWP